MWLVMNIGCIECGVSSKIVGVFTAKAKADEVAATCEASHSWQHGGHNEFEVFEIPPAEVVDAEYLDVDA